MRKPDDINYSEYYIRKTIQPFSLRSPTKRIEVGVDTKRNFSLHINKKTAQLRLKHGQNTSVRELFMLDDSKGPGIFPNVTGIREFKIKKHSKSFALPQDKITRRVIEYLDEQVPRDYFFVETPATLPKSKSAKKVEDTSAEQTIKRVIMEHLPDRDVQKYQNLFNNKVLFQQLKEFRAKKSINEPIRTFYTAVKDDDGSLDESKSSIHTKTSNSRAQTSSAFLRNMLKKKEREIEEKTLEEICKQNGLNTTRLLGVGEWVYEGGVVYKKPVNKQDLSKYDTDDIALAKAEVERNARELNQFKKGQMTYAVDSHYRKEKQKNLLFDQASLSKMKNLRLMSYEDERPTQFMKSRTRKVLAMRELRNLTDNFSSIGTSSVLHRTTASLSSVPTFHGETETDPLLELENFKLSLDKDELNSLKVENVLTLPEDQQTKAHTEATTDAFTASMRSSIRTRSKFYSPQHSKFSEEFEQIKKNFETTNNIKKSVSNFYDRLKKVSDLNERDSALLEEQLYMIWGQMQAEFDQIKESKEQPVSTISPEFAVYKERKNFKNKLSDHIMSKIVDTHAFVNAYNNKKQRDKLRSTLTHMLKNMLKGYLAAKNK